MRINVQFIYLLFLGLFAGWHNQVLQAQNLEWAIGVLGGGSATPENPNNGNAIVTGLTLDETGENVVITGTCSGVVDFDPSAQTSLSSGEFTNIFIAKYNVDGNLIWVRFIEGLESSFTISPPLIDMDAQNNIYIAGSSNTRLDFDPGIGIQQIDIAAENNSYLYVAKFNDDGQILWANGKDSYFYVLTQDLDVSPQGEIALTGKSYQTYDLGLGNDNWMVSSDDYSIFYAKYDTDGQIQWGHVLSEIGIYGEARSIIFDPAGNIIICGRFSNSPDFDPAQGETILMSDSWLGDMYLAKYTPDGLLTWAIHQDIYFIGNGLNMQITTDALGNIYMTGDYTDPADFDPGPGVTVLNSSFGNTPGFISKFSPQGELSWAKSIHGSISPNQIKLNEDGNIFIAGSFISADFSPGPASEILYTIAPSAFSNFYAKFNAEGDNCWARVIGNNGYGGSILYPTLDVQGDQLFIGGGFKQTGDFDPSNSLYELTVQGIGINGFLARYDSPDISLNLGGDVDLCLGESIVLNPGIADVDYLWNDASTDTTYIAQGNEVVSLEISFKNCPMAKDSIFVKTIDCTVSLLLPNVFTPNHDGTNDFFAPIEYIGIQKADIYIYNRWGNLIYQSNEVEKGWNGKNKESMCSDGIYYWKIDYIDIHQTAKNLTGHCTLLGNP